MMMRRLSVAARVAIPAAAAMLVLGGALVTPAAASTLGVTSFAAYGQQDDIHARAITKMHQYEQRTSQSCTEVNFKVTPLASFPPSYKGVLTATCSDWGIPG